MTLDRNFRAAINGFNRSDVVNYIEECSINHERALRQLRDENARLRTTPPGSLRHPAATSTP